MTWLDFKRVCGMIIMFMGMTKRQSNISSLCLFWKDLCYWGGRLGVSHNRETINVLSIMSTRPTLKYTILKWFFLFITVSCSSKKHIGVFLQTTPTSDQSLFLRVTYNNQGSQAHIAEVGKWFLVPLGKN